MMSLSRKRYFLISSYVFSLSLIGLFSMLLCVGLLFYFLCESHSGDYLQTFANYWSVFVVTLFILLFYIIVCFKNAFEFFGIVEISDTELIFHAPFRQAIKYRYSDILDIGIDYGWLSVNKQFWIFIGKRKIPHQYCHRINRMPINHEFIRIQYSADLFDSLQAKIPITLKKRLYNSRSAINNN